MKYAPNAVEWEKMPLKLNKTDYSIINLPGMLISRLEGTT